MNNNHNVLGAVLAYAVEDQDSEDSFAYEESTIEQACQALFRDLNSVDGAAYFFWLQKNITKIDDRLFSFPGGFEDAEIGDYCSCDASVWEVVCAFAKDTDTLGYFVWGTLSGQGIGLWEFWDASELGAFPSRAGYC